MKKCLKCGQTYVDETLNFCLSDGERLVELRGGYNPPATEYADDSPPTLMMNEPRVTNPIEWGHGGPPAAWQNQSPVPVTQQYPAVGFGSETPNQTLPTISLVLGIISCIMVCCAGGIWLGLPAAIVGYIALRNADNYPNRYGGRGLAIGGMVLGIITFLASLFILIFGQLS